MQVFVGIALGVQNKLEICDKKGKQMTMRFAKIYTAEKMGRIVERAQTYWWWRKNPTAAFMKAVGEINHEQKEANKAIDKLAAQRKVSQEAS